MQSSDLQVNAGSVREIARRLDHTLLKADATNTAIARLCDEAAEYGFATVCVNPSWVRFCTGRLAVGGVKVCTTVGFPLGASATASKVYESRLALEDGARELDVVINVGKLLDGDTAYVQQEIAEIARVVHGSGGILKVILETALLNDGQKSLACRLAVQAEADFVKTSTGFGPGGATEHDVRLMRQAVGPVVGVKASGGIRTYEDARRMLAAGATRLGASASVAIVRGAAAAESAGV